MDDTADPPMKPVLFVTGHAPAYRLGAFACLHEAELVEFALFGGRLKHGGEMAAATRRSPRDARTHGSSPGGSSPAVAADLPFPHRHVREHELYALARSGRYRAVVCSTGGRVALGATWAGARRARVPLILWASLWAHPRSVPHAFSYVALRRLYRSADAVVTYGPHVSAYVRRHGAQRVHVAPQSVDNAFWSSPEVSVPSDPEWPAGAAVKFLFAGRPAREKGLGVLVEAWSISGLQVPAAALVLVGAGSTPPWVPAGGAVVCLPPADPSELRNFYAAADVLVLPSIPTRTFREPWGLVVNEAMNRGLPVIASDAVGAAGGGLARDGRNGLIVPAADPIALAAALKRLAGDPAFRTRLGEAGREDVRAYTHEAWAAGFSQALADLGVSRGGPQALQGTVR
jgi:glycosyltransferase involved in cell wall biosynthesis